MVDIIQYIKKLDLELSSLKLDVFMYVEVKECVGGRNPKDASECVSKLTLDAVWKFGGSSGNIDPVSSMRNCALLRNCNCALAD